MSQTSECYTIEDALINKVEVESIYLNYNFQEIKPISDSIGLISSLKEFRIQPRWFDFPKIVDKKVISERIDNSQNKSPLTLPDGITKCDNLELIDISNTDVCYLPNNFGLLKNLKTLIMNGSKINLDAEIDKMLSLTNIKEIQIFGLEVSEENLGKLKTIKYLKILRETDDFDFEDSEEQTVDVQIHDTYIVFPDEEQADRFINSMPFGLGSTARKYKKGNR